MTLFPWLSGGPAMSWEKYRFRKLKFTYVPRCSTSTAGVIILSPDYDAGDITPDTEQVACSFAGSVSGSAWAEISCNFTPQGMHGGIQWKLIRDSPVARTSRLSYDVGSIFVSTVDMAGTNAVGRLWAEYDLEMICPQSGIKSMLATQGSIYEQRTGEVFLTATPANMNFTLVKDGAEVGTQTLGVWTPPKGHWRVDGSVMFSNDTAEFTAALIEFLEGGVMTQQSFVSGHPASAPYTAAIPIHFECELNGATTVALQATATGAAGTLTLNTQALTWSLA